MQRMILDIPCFRLSGFPSVIAKINADYCVQHICYGVFIKQMILQPLKITNSFYSLTLTHAVTKLTTVLHYNTTLPAKKAAAKKEESEEEEDSEDDEESEEEKSAKKSAAKTKPGELVKKSRNQWGE